jgi:hypothetical protein
LMPISHFREEISFHNQITYPWNSGTRLMQSKLMLSSDYCDQLFYAS